MTEVSLNILAIAIEIGFPLVLLGIAAKYPSTKPKVASIIGAVSPLLVAYIATWITWLFSDRSSEASFGIHAMWVMSFFVYLMAFAIGVCLSFSQRPASIVWRFVSAAASSVAAIGIFLLVEAWI